LTIINKKIRFSVFLLAGFILSIFIILSPTNFYSPIIKCEEIQDQYFNALDTSDPNNVPIEEWTLPFYLSNSLVKAFAMTIDSQGDIYVAGDVFDVYTERTRPFLAKFDSSGFQLWFEVYPPTPDLINIHIEAIALDSSNNKVYIAGYIESYIVEGGHKSMFLSQYSTDGELQETIYHDPVDSPTPYESSTCTSIKIDEVGDIYLAGNYFEAYTWKPYPALIKCGGESLSKIWSQIFFDSMEETIIEAISLDSINNIYLAGYSTNGFDSSAFMLKYDNLGNLIDLMYGDYEFAGNVCPTYISSMEIDVWGNIYLAGNVFDISGSTMRPILIKFTGGDYLTSNPEWYKIFNYPGDLYIDAIALDSLNHVYIAGDTGNEWEMSIFLAKYDQYGSIFYSMSKNVLDSDLGCSSMMIDPLNNIFLTGYGLCWEEYHESRYSSSYLAKFFTNRAPVANDGYISADQGSPVSIELTASDDDGDLLTYVIVRDPSNGTLTGTFPNLIYEPNGNFYGKDYFTFTVNDGYIDSNLATIEISVNQADILPFIVDDDISNGAGDYTWAEAVLEPWCTGSGSLSDPYIIQNIIIDGDGVGSCITIQDSDAYFIIQDCTTYNAGSIGPSAGILLSNTINGQLINNNCSFNGRFGIHLVYSSYNSLIGNVAEGNSEYGFFLYHDSYNTLKDNIIKNNPTGIHSSSSYMDLFLNNEEHNSRSYGYRLMYGINNTLIGNRGSGNVLGGSTYYLEFASNTTIKNNLALNNPNGAGFNIDRSYDNNLITGNIAEDCLGGFYLRLFNSTITNNTALNIQNGFKVSSSSGNILKNNTIVGDTFGMGIQLYECTDHLLVKNTITNSFYGVFILSNTNETIIYENNIIESGGFGVYIAAECYNNLISHNNFINNTGQVFDQTPGNNLWYHPDLLEGNYWSDYPGVDDGSGSDKHAIAGDGIGDTQIPWPSLHFDLYPFMEKFPYFESGPIPSGPIFIDGAATGIGAHNWTWAVTYKVCTGSGTINNPFIIRDFIIDGGGTSSCIEIVDSNEFFVIHNCHLYNSNIGIKLDTVTNGKLIGNNCSNNKYGLWLLYSSNITIDGNILTHNNYEGVFLHTSSGITLSNNLISYNRDGITSFASTHNKISENTISYNSENGVYLYENSKINILYGNVVSNNRIGYYAVESSDNFFSESTLTDNTYIGIYLHISCNHNNITGNLVINNIDTYWGIYAYKSNYTIIKDNIVTGIFSYTYAIDVNSGSFNLIAGNSVFNSYIGIAVRSSTYNNITFNTVENNTKGILMYSSSNNNVLLNYVNGSSDYALYIYELSNDNSVNENTLTFNRIGLYIVDSSSNTLFRNEISDNFDGLYLVGAFNNIIIDNGVQRNNHYGIRLYNSMENIIYHNDIIDNVIQAHDSSLGNNFWYHPELLEGNYWSNYLGVDLDDNGIGDTPYLINAGNQDYYPIWDDGPACPPLRDSTTLTGDVHIGEGESITFEADGITLDGNGFTLIGDNSGIGITIIGVENITIKNLIIIDCEIGVLVQDSLGVIIENCTFSNSILYDCLLLDSTIFDSVIQDSEIIGSETSGCSLINNQIEESFTENSDIINSIIRFVTSNNDSISYSSIYDSEIFEDRILGSNVTNTIIINGDVQESSIIGGIISSGTIWNSFLENLEMEAVAIGADGCVDENACKAAVVKVSALHCDVADCFTDDCIFELSVISNCIINNSKLLDTVVIGSAIQGTEILGDSNVDVSELVNCLMEEGFTESSDIIDCILRFATSNNDSISYSSIYNSEIFEDRIVGSQVTYSTIQSGEIRESSIIGGLISGSTIWNSNLEKLEVENATIESESFGGFTDSAFQCIIDDSKIEGGVYSANNISSSNIFASELRDNLIVGSIITYGDIYGGIVEGTTITESTIQGTEILGDSNVDVSELVSCLMEEGFTENSDIIDSLLRLITSNNDSIFYTSVRDSDLFNDRIVGSQISDGNIEECDLIDCTIDSCTLSNNVIINFDNALNSETTTIDRDIIGPSSPAGVDITGNYYEITTDATYTDTITISLPYDETNVVGNEEDLTLGHWEESTEEWVDVTTWVDTENNAIYGIITHFSVFAVMEQRDFAPPESELIISNCFVEENEEYEITYVTEYSSFLLTANDDLSGVAQIFYRINGGNWIEFFDSFNLAGPNGNYIIEYYSIDKLGNVEDIQQNTDLKLVNLEISSYLGDGDNNPISYFDLIIKDRKSDGYEIVATNPGQIFYYIEITNVWPIEINSLCFTLGIPEDFILKGTNPIHVYSEEADITEWCTIEGFNITVSNIFSKSSIKVIIHLDYGLKNIIYDTLEEIAMNGYLFTTGVAAHGEALTQSASVHSNLIAHQKKLTAIAGYVMYIDGNPVQNVVIELYDSDGQFLGTTLTDEDGFFYFIDMAEGDYEVHIYYENYTDFEIVTAISDELTQVFFIIPD